MNKAPLLSNSPRSVRGLKIEPLDPEDRPFYVEKKKDPPDGMICPKCGHGEVLVEIRASVVLPFEKKVRVDLFRIGKVIRKACCASCGFNIREMIAIS